MKKLFYFLFALFPLLLLFDPSNDCLKQDLIQACDAGDFHKVESLLKENRHLKNLKFNCRSPLHSAVQQGDLKLIQILVDSGFNLNSLDVNGKSPLHYAVFLNDTHVVRLLLESGADPNISDYEGYTPLYDAVYQGNYELTRLLISFHADPTQLNLHGDSVYYFMKMVRPRKYDKIRSLIKKNSKTISAIEKEKILLKRLGHIWKIEKTVHLKPLDPKQSEISLHLTGAHPAHFYRYLKTRIYRSKSADGKRVFFSDHSEYLKQFLNHGAHLYLQNDAKKLLSRIQSGEPTPILSGWSDHAVQFLFWTDRLVLCNRGAGSCSPVEIFHYDPSKLNVGVIEDLLLLTSKDRNAYEKLIRESLPTTLQMKKGDFEIAFEKSSLINFHMCNNCAWESVEGILYAFLVLDTFKQTSPDLGHVDKMSLANVMFKKFLELNECLKFLKQEVVLHFLEFHTDGHSVFHMDQDLILGILRKNDSNELGAYRAIVRLSKCLKFQNIH